MKAMLFEAYGPPDVLHDAILPDPVAGPGDVVVEVHAVSVNRVLDAGVRSGDGPRYGVELPHVPGVDPSGVVVEVGEGVDDLRVGDRVAVTLALPDGGGLFGVNCFGGAAERTLASASCCLKLPDGVPFADATAICRHGPVAYNLLFNMGELAEGQSVLILGPAGNLGSIGIQLAKAAGATVIAAAGSDERAETGRQLGADHVVNYNAANLRDVVKEITGGEGVDLFYDNIANPEVCPLGIESLKPQGRMVTAGAHGGPVAPVDFGVVYYSRLTIMGNPHSNPLDAVPCLEAASRGELEVLIDRIVPLSEAPAMHALVESDPGVGKIILDPTLG